MSQPATDSAARGEARRVIKRYANRKMYDTERSCYVTLEEIAELVRGGVDVQVIDNATKADLTEVTLAQALLDSQRRHRQPVSLSGLRTLISQGGDLLTRNLADVARARTDVERTVEKWRSEAERKVGRVLHRGRDDLDVELDAELRDAIADTRGVDVAGEAEAAAIEAGAGAAAPTTAAEVGAALAGAFDERLRRIAEALGVASRRHDDGLHVIAARLEALEDRLTALEARLHDDSRPRQGDAAAAADYDKGGRSAAPPAAGLKRRGR